MERNKLKFLEALVIKHVGQIVDAAQSLQLLDNLAVMLSHSTSNWYIIMTNVVKSFFGQLPNAFASDEDTPTPSSPSAHTPSVSACGE